MYRQILGAPGYGQGEALRGEIGASSMKARIREEQRKFLRYAKEGRNDLLRRVIEEMMKTKKIRWMKDLVKEFQCIRSQSESSRSMTDGGIKAEMKEGGRKEVEERNE